MMGSRAILLVVASLLITALALHAASAQPLPQYVPPVVLEGTIPLPPGSTPQELEIDPNTGYVYVNDDSGDRVFVINGTELLATVPVGEGPLAPVVNPATGYVYVASVWSDTVSVINGTELIASIDVVDIGEQPWLEKHRLAVNPVSGYIYVVGEDAAISIIRGTEHVLDMTLPMLRASRPVINPDTGYVYFPGKIERPDTPWHTQGAIAVISGTELVTTIVEPDAEQIHQPSAVNKSTGYVYITNSRGVHPAVFGGISVLNGTEIVVDLYSYGVPRYILPSPWDGRVYVGTGAAGVGIIYETRVRHWIHVDDMRYTNIYDMVIKPGAVAVYATVLGRWNGYLALVEGGEATAMLLELRARWLAINDQTGYVYVSGENGLVVVRDASVVQTFPDIPLGHLLVDSSSGYVYLADSSPSGSPGENGVIWVFREISPPPYQIILPIIVNSYEPPS